MSDTQTLSSSFREKDSSLGWIAICVLVLFSALCLLAGAGSILRLAFIVGSFAVGVFLYRRYPLLYIGFTWWLWFLTPLVRRLVDYRSGWDQRGVILLSPILVTLITCVAFFKYLPRASRLGGLPFVLSFIGVFYGLMIGLVNTSPMAAAQALLIWFTPIPFSFYLFINWRHYPELRQNIQRTFLWGVLVMGIYAIVQYVVAPEWDRFWLISSGLITSAGSPEPFGMRVWSTMNSTQPFGVAMLAGLLLLFSSEDNLRIPASMAGYLAFLLTTVRSAWLGWLVGLVTLLTSLKPKFQMRLIITILVLVICVFPLTTISPFSEMINSRLQTFSNLENDTSANDRANTYQKTLGIALSQVLGKGIGNNVITTAEGKVETIQMDSGILDTLFAIGWFGTIFYLGGILLIFFNLFHNSESSFDPFACAARAIGVGLFVQTPLSSMTLGVGGVIFWSFLSMGMAANKYHQHQRITARSKI